jgi:hypothetical protein
VTLRDLLDIFYNLRCKGILCSTVETFVAIDHRQQVILYHLQKGLRWALPFLENINSVIPIHRNTGFAAAGQGAAHIVDIAHSVISQVLEQGMPGYALAKGWLIQCFRRLIHHKK